MHTVNTNGFGIYIYSCCVLRLKGPGDFDIIANCITATNNCYQCLNSVGKVNTCFMPRQLSIFDFKQKCNMLWHNIHVNHHIWTFFPYVSLPKVQSMSRTRLSRHCVVKQNKNYWYIIGISMWRIWLSDSKFCTFAQWKFVYWFDMQCIAEQQYLQILIYYRFSSHECMVNIYSNACFYWDCLRLH